MGISVQRTVQHNETTGGPFWRLRTYDPKRFDRACMYISHRNFIWPLWRHSRFQLVPSRTKASVSQADISIGASPIDPGRRGPEGNELHPHPIRSAGKLLERWTFCGFRVPRKVNIRQRIPISWQPFRQRGVSYKTDSGWTRSGTGLRTPLPYTIPD